MSKRRKSRLRFPLTIREPKKMPDQLHGLGADKWHWGEVLAEAGGDSSKLYGRDHGWTMNPQDPAPGSQERLDLVRSLAKSQAAARKLAEEREAAMTPEEREAAQAAIDEGARQEDAILHEEAKHQRKRRDLLTSLDANLPATPMAVRGGDFDPKGGLDRMEQIPPPYGSGYSRPTGRTYYDDSSGDALTNHRGRTGNPLGRRPALVKIGEAVSADRTKRGREQWLREHPARPADFPEKQWEACQLVYGHVGDDGEAGRRMRPPITKQAVAKLRKKAAARGLLDPRPW